MTRYRGGNPRRAQAGRRSCVGEAWSVRDIGPARVVDVVGNAWLTRRGGCGRRPAGGLRRTGAESRLGTPCRVDTPCRVGAQRGDTRCRVRDASRIRGPRRVGRCRPAAGLRWIGGPDRGLPWIGRPSQGMPGIGRSSGDTGLHRFIVLPWDRALRWTQGLGGAGRPRGVMRWASGARPRSMAWLNLDGKSRCTSRLGLGGRSGRTNRPCSGGGRSSSWVARQGCVGRPRCMTRHGPGGGLRCIRRPAGGGGRSCPSRRLRSGSDLPCAGGRGRGRRDPGRIGGRRWGGAPDRLGLRRRRTPRFPAGRGRGGAG
jgi:hypothetical protein